MNKTNEIKEKDQQFRNQFEILLEKFYGNKYYDGNGGYIIMLIEEMCIDTVTGIGNNVKCITDYTPHICPHCNTVLRNVFNSAIEDLASVQQDNF